MAPVAADGFAAWLTKAISDRLPSKRAFYRAYARHARVTEGSAKSTMYRWLRGENVPDEATRVVIARVLKLRKADLPAPARRSTRRRLVAVEDRPVTRREIDPWLRVVQLLTEGRVREARQALPEAREDQ